MLASLSVLNLLSHTPPGMRSGGNSRVEILPNRPIAQRGGGSLQRSG